MIAERWTGCFIKCYLIVSWVSLICTLSSTCLDKFGLYVYRKFLCCVLSTTAKRSTEPGLSDTHPSANFRRRTHSIVLGKYNSGPWLTCALYSVFFSYRKFIMNVIRALPRQLIRPLQSSEMLQEAGRLHVIIASLNCVVYKVLVYLLNMTFTTKYTFI